MVNEPTQGAAEAPDQGSAHGSTMASFETMVPEAPEFSSTYSKDYWDLVFEQLGKRVLFKVGVAILTLLYGVAIFAPLIANDRPYVIESVDVKAFGDAIRPLRAMATGASVIAKKTNEEVAAEVAANDTLGPDAPRTRAEQLAVEREAAQLRIDTMKSMLSEADAAPLDRYLALFDEALELAKDGPSDAAQEKFSEAKTLARGFRKEMKPLDPNEPEAGGLALTSRREYPALDGIAPWEAAMMAMWIFWALWPLWNFIVNRILLFGNRNLVRAARKVKVLAFVLVGVVGAFMWHGKFGGVAEFDISTHKARLTDGDLVLLKAGKTTGDLVAAETDEARAELTGEIVWPPVTMGFAELHEPEGYREPTWTRLSVMEPETGRYVNKPQVVDPSTGELPNPNPPHVRAGEPDVNDAGRHWLGTDESGRDVLSRMIWGSRVSLSVGILSALLLTLIGIVIGSTAGFFGGRIDDLIMRGIEILQSIPAFFLILLALAFTDPETVPPMFAIVIVIAIVRWTGVARLVRGEFLRLREQEFVVAAQALGFSSARTIFRHVLPNAMSPVLVAAAFSVAAGILTESAVSFLGFGISEPDASWGSIVNDSKNPAHWWIQVFPGLAIFVTVTCYNLVGDAIRDAMDPKMKV